MTPIPELNGQILVSKSGQIYLQGPATNLAFPMLLVRHGQTDGNLRRVLQGRTDGPENQLNTTGIEQAKSTAAAITAELDQRFGRRRFIEMGRTGRLVVLTSPITRAKKTAGCFRQHVQETVGIELAVEGEPDLMEIHFGRFDGRALDEIDDAQFAALVKRYRATQDATIDWQGTGESFLQVLRRAKELLERLNRSYNGKLVIAFSHGTFISALRTVVGESSIRDQSGKIAFRDHIIDHAQPHWLGESLRLLSTIDGG